MYLSVLKVINKYCIMQIGSAYGDFPTIVLNKKTKQMERVSTDQIYDYLFSSKREAISIMKSSFLVRRTNKGEHIYELLKEKP